MRALDLFRSPILNGSFSGGTSSSFRAHPIAIAFYPIICHSIYLIICVAHELNPTNKQPPNKHKPPVPLIYFLLFCIHHLAPNTQHTQRTHTLGAATSFVRRGQKMTSGRTRSDQTTHQARQPQHTVNVTHSPLLAKLVVNRRNEAARDRRCVAFTSGLKIIRNYAQRTCTVHNALAAYLTSGASTDRTSRAEDEEAKRHVDDDQKWATISTKGLLYFTSGLFAHPFGRIV